VIYLSGVSRPELRDVLPAHDLGLMWTPKAWAAAQHVDGASWAADNGCFTLGERFDAASWLRWLTARRELAGCLFAVAPDVVGDAAATAVRSAPHLEQIRQLGYRAAYVLQDGQEHLPMPWEQIDAVFIGGSTEWKLSEHAARLVYQAKARGLWAHMGRVNSRKRLLRAAVMGCDSVDGTFLLRGAPGENLARMAVWMRAAERFPVLPISA
jgi:hypothetical protein